MPRVDNKLIFRSRNTLYCEICGKVINPGDLYYKRYTPSQVVKCISCYESDYEKWIKNKVDYDVLLDQFKDLMYSYSATDENLLKLCSVETRRRALIHLESAGYHFVWSNNSMILIDFPEMYQFIQELFTNDVDILLFNKFSKCWICVIVCIVLKWRPTLDDFYVVCNDRGYELYFNDKEKVEPCFADFLRVCTEIVNNKSFVDSLLEKGIIGNQGYHVNKDPDVPNVDYSDYFELDDPAKDDPAKDDNKIVPIIPQKNVNYATIQTDDKLYEQVCEDNRLIVLSTLLECVFRECDDILVIGDGKILVDGNERNYSLILDESLLSEESLSDYDIIFCDGEMLCFDNVNVIDPQSFEECFGQGNNTLVSKMIKYMVDLVGSGF